MDQLEKFYPKIKKVSEIILNSTVIIICFFFTSLIYSYLINNNKAIIPFYIGIILCIILSSKLSKLFKNVNNNDNYKDIYSIVIHYASITNYSSVIKNLFSKINIFSKTIKKKSEDNSISITPNVFFTVLIFCYLYLVLCFSFSYDLTNYKETPKIISFLKGMIVFYILSYIIYCSLILFKIKKNGILKTKHFDFILNIGIYNLITSTIIGLLIAFIYFNLIKTFSRKNLFFQNTKFCKKGDDGDELCYYEPVRSNWGYDN